MISIIVYVLEFLKSYLREIQNIFARKTILLYIRLETMVTLIFKILLTEVIE